MSILDIENQFVLNEQYKSKLIIDGTDSTWPLVSIMIPTYRRPDLLREAILSVLSQKTDVIFEVVVVDNEMNIFFSEKVDAVIRHFNDGRVRLFRNSKNIGMFGNWNRCIELARSEWVSILNDDDLFSTNFIESAFDVLNKNKNINLLFARSEFIDERGSRLKKTLSRLKQNIKKINVGFFDRNISKICTEDVFLDPPCSSLAMLFRRDSAISIGGFKESAYPSADYVFFVIYHLKFGTYRLNKYLAYYRIHENETAQPSTGEGFISKNLELRRQLENVIDWPKFFMRLYAQLYALKTISQYKSFWKINLDLKKIRNENKLPQIPVQPFYLIVRYILRFCFFYKNLLKNN